MALRPTLRLFWQRPLYRFALLGLLLAVVAAWYVISRGGWVNVLHLPPVLDASTPRSQNGFTLEDIKPPGDEDREDAVVLLVRPPAFPHLTAQYQTSEGVFVYGSSFGSRVPLLQASAQTSTGDVTPLNWKIIGTQAEPQFYRIEIPSGYSNDCRYVNVTLVPNTGPFPRWRITHLPNMRHAVPPPSTPTDTVTKDGITVSARTWHEKNGLVSYLLHPVLPPDSHQWEVVTTGEWHEWESFAYDGQVRVYKDSGMPILGRNGVFNADSERWYGGGIHNSAGLDAYPHMNHFLRLTCELDQFETYDETVTFHNLAVKQDWDGPSFYGYKIFYLVVPHSLTLTTPSGVSVTLPMQGQTRNPMMNIGDFNFQMSVTAFDHPTHLARSPLVLQFGKPITTSVQFAPPYASAGQTLNPGDTQTYSLRPPTNPAWHVTPKGVPRIPYNLDVPPVLKDFTVIVRQRVDLQTMPMAFTLPITDASPSYYPNGYRRPKRL